MSQIAHLIKAHVLAMQQEQHGPVYGHVASYDPIAGTVRVVIPSMRDENDVPVLSPEMPFGVPAIGFQYHPKTGATLDNPTGGEQCQVGFFGVSGVSAAPCFHYGAKMQPPAVMLSAAGDPLTPGETIISTGPASWVRIRANQTVDVMGAANVNLGDLTKALLHVMDERMVALFNNHTHGNVQNGSGTTGQPVTQLTIPQTCTTQTKAN